MYLPGNHPRFLRIKKFKSKVHEPGIDKANLQSMKGCMNLVDGYPVAAEIVGVGEGPPAGEQQVTGGWG